MFKLMIGSLYNSYSEFNNFNYKIRFIIERGLLSQFDTITLEVREFVLRSVDVMGMLHLVCALPSPCTSVLYRILKSFSNHFYKQI